MRLSQKIAISVFFIAMIIFGISVDFSDLLVTANSLLGNKPKCTCYFPTTNKFGVINSKRKCAAIECQIPNDTNPLINDVKICDNPQNEVLR